MTKTITVQYRLFVNYQIIDFLELHSFMSMDQSAYLKMHSTQTCLYRVIDDWLGHVNDGEITGACLLDISKCFDSINHILLLKKLEMYGIIGTELDWFSSYLNGRKQSSAMVIGSKSQLQSLNLDDFAICVNVDKLQLVEQAKCLGLWVRNDLSWDDHILELCRKMYYHVHIFRRLRKILLSQLLLNIYKSYVQSKIDYGLSIWGCTTEANLDRMQIIQNLLARIMCNIFDYIIFRGIEMRIQTIRDERRDYFLRVCILMCIHGLASHYLCNDVTIYIDINGYDTRSAENMDLYLPRCSREIHNRSFL